MEQDQSTKENNEQLKDLETRLKRLLYSTKFCGICYEIDMLTSLLVDINVVLEDAFYKQSLFDMVEDVFHCDVQEVLSAPYLCNKCLDKMLGSYKFIQQTRDSAKLMDDYVNDFNYKIDDLEKQLDPARNYDDCNVVIMLDNHKSVQEVLKNNTIREEHKREMIETKYIEHYSDIPNYFENYKNDTNEIDDSAYDDLLDVLQCKNKPMDNITDTNKENHIASMNTAHIKNEDSAFSILDTLETVCEVISEGTEVLPSEQRKAHQCDDCNLIFLDENMFKEHQATHLDFEDLDMANKCTACDQIFEDRDDLLEHVKQHTIEDTEQETQCMTCKQFLTEDEIMSHECKIECPDCSEIPCIHSKYLQHFCSEALNVTRKIKCLECNFACKQKHTMISHVNKDHLKLPLHTCEICYLKFNIKSNLRNHFLKYHSDHYGCPYCEKPCFNSEEYEGHIESCKEQQREHPCDNCVASFESEADLIQHIEKRHKIQTFPCDLCSHESFATEALLNMHKYQKHNVTRPVGRVNDYRCPLCNEQFDMKGEVMNHLRNDHDSFPCDICKIEFPTWRHLLIHKKQHKRVNCEKCNKDLPQNKLKAHMKTHDENSNNYRQVIKKKVNKAKIKIVNKNETSDNLKLKRKLKNQLSCHCCEYVAHSKWQIEAHLNEEHFNAKPYSCKDCDEQFVSRLHLKHHMVTHGKKVVKHSCKFCNKVFLTSKCLTMHTMAIHPANKQLKCELCKNTYPTIYALRSHRVSHFKSVPCPLCSTDFYTIKEVRNHVKKVHWKDDGRKFDFRDVEGLEEKDYGLFM